MFKYKCLNPIAQVGLNNFPEGYVKVEEGDAAEIILVRSAKMHEMEFEPELLAVARAGAGVNNIPLDRCAEQGIVVFNTPGANANGVKELFVFAAIASLRDVVGGIGWTKENADDPEIAARTEKEKKRFVGHEIFGKKLAVIGLGAIGAKVANVAVDLGMEVAGYDAFLNEAMKAQLKPEVKIAESMEALVADADMISVHVPALDATKGMINADLLAKCKDGLVVINLARDTLVNEADMTAALESGKVSKYVCDFPTAGAAKMKNVILIPHLGALTEESEDNCAIMAVQEVTDFLENGNIKNSVNYPAADLGPVSKTRVCVAHKASLNADALLAEAGLKAENMVSKTRGGFAYSLFDVASAEGAEEKLAALDGVLKVRVICK